MERKSSNLLKKGLMKSNSDFTSSLMSQINTEEQALKSVLSKHGNLTTSANFTAQLMKDIGPSQPAVPYVPVISKRAWIGLAAAFVGVITLAVFSADQSTSEIPIQQNIEHLTAGIDSLFTENTLFSYSLLGVLLLSFSLIIEQRLRKKTV